MSPDPFEMDLTGLGTSQQPAAPAPVDPNAAPVAPVAPVPQAPAVSLDTLRAAFEQDPMLAAQVVALAQARAGAIPATTPQAPAAPQKTQEEIELETAMTRWEALTAKYQTGEINWDESLERDRLAMRIPAMQVQITQTQAQRIQQEQQAQQQQLLASVDTFAAQGMGYIAQYYPESARTLSTLLTPEQQTQYLKGQIANLISSGNGHLLRDSSAVGLLLSRAIVEMQNLGRSQNPATPPAAINSLDPNAQARMTQQQQQVQPGDYTPMQRRKV